MFASKLRGEYMYSAEQIRELARTGRIEEFYHDHAWEKLSRQVRREQKECYFCKLRGRVGPNTLVHHRYEVTKYPEYAYRRYYVDALGRSHINLVACCFPCHEAQHGRGTFTPHKHFTNAERW